MLHLIGVDSQSSLNSAMIEVLEGLLWHLLLARNRGLTSAKARVLKGSYMILSNSNRKQSE